MPAPTLAQIFEQIVGLSRRPEPRRRAFVFVLVGALSLVPMAGTLGYFSSLILAPVLSLLAAASGVDRVRELRASLAGREDHGPGLWLLLGHGARDLGWLLGLSLGLLLLGQLWTVNCDPLGGLAYFAMGPLCSAIIGWSCGVAGAIVVGEGRRALALLAGWAPFLLCLVIGVRRLYLDPVVFAYDPFWGWFSGPIYDEGVAIDRRYLLYRATNLAALVGLWLALRAGVDAKLRGSWRRALADGPARLRSSIALVLALACLATAAHADRLGFTATTESLARVLSATRETEHFVIRYSPTSLTAREIDSVAAEHEFAWARLEARLGTAPKRKVDSFVFENGKQRRILLGADQVEVSPPWRQQMYLSHRPWPHDVLHHELAHAFLGEVGDPLLGLPISGGRINGALVEGVPTALAPRPLDNLGLHEQAAVLDRLDKRPPLSEIMGAGFWGAAATRAYTAAGSFVLWLAQTHGWPTIAELYANAGDFEATYGAELPALEAEWLAFIRALPLRDQDVEALAQRYQRSSVFRRPCAHRAAQLNHEAARARLREQREEALDLQRTLCRIEPDQPVHFLRLADMLAGWGDYAEASLVLDELAARGELTATIRAVIEEQRGDTALVAGRLDEAASYYREAMTYHPGEDRRRQLQVKGIAARDGELAPLMADYFDPFTPKGAAVGTGNTALRLWTALEIARLPRHRALGNYLAGRQLLIIAAPQQAFEVLSIALAPPAGAVELGTVELRREAGLSLVRAATQIHEWQRARVELERVEALAEGQGHREEVELWRARIDFFEGYFDGSREEGSPDENASAE